jgi:O-antigen ligase
MEKTLNHDLLKGPLLWLFALGLFACGLTFSALFHISLFLPITIIIGIASCILFIRNPLLLLCLLIITRMILDYSAEYFSFRLFDISLSLSQLVGVGIALLGVFILTLRRDTLPRFPLVLPFFILFLWGVTTLAYSIAPYETLQELLRFFNLFVLGFLAYVAVQKTSDFQSLLSAIFISGILPIAFALYQFIFSLGFQDDAVSIPRIFGTFSHPNVFSLYLFALIVFAALYFLVFARSNRNQLFTLLFLGSLACVLLLTFARVAWLALFVFTFLLALFRYRFLLIPIIFLPLVLFALSSDFQERVLASFSPHPDSSIIWRQNLWHDVTTKSIQDGNLWLGSGMDTFPIVSESLRGSTFGSNDPHNDFVKFFIEGGIVGVLVYILYLASILFLLLKNYFRSRPGSALQLSFGILILFFFSLQIASLSDNVFKNTPVQWLFFIALGALLALAEKKNAHHQA